MSKPLNAIVFFADLISSSRMSDVLRPGDYIQVLKEFQRLGHKVLDELSSTLHPLQGMIKKIDGGINGEEIRIVVVLSDPRECENGLNDKVQLIVLAVFQAAMELSLQWHLSTTLNQQKVKNIASPTRVGIGLHYGKVQLTELEQGRWNENNQWVHQNTALIPLSSSLNFGKRVEAASRLSQGIAITVSQSFYTLCVENGVPIALGEKLSTEPKGFEYAQPIYDLKNQYVLLTNSYLMGKSAPLLLKDALYHDPNRILLFYAMLIENFISEASFSQRGDSKKYFNSAVEYAKYPLGVVEKSAYFHWLLAIAYYRRSSMNRKKMEIQSDINLSIKHYEQAAGELTWATLDLAAAYMKRAYLVHPNAKPDLEDLRTSHRLLSRLIEKDPLLFHAYNVRAYVVADLNINGISDISLDQAMHDMDMAERLNRRPGYLYAGTRANIEYAKVILRKNTNKRSGLNSLKENVCVLLNKANECLDHSIDENKKYRNVQGDEIPSYHFWRQGYTDPPYHPPRPDSLRRSWKLLEEKMKEEP